MFLPELRVGVNCLLLKYFYDVFIRVVMGNPDLIHLTGAIYRHRFANRGNNRYGAHFFL